MSLAPSSTHSSPTYIFLDESGNFDFSSKGTRFFVLTSVSMERPFPAYSDLDSLKYDCLEDPSLPDLEYFHCANDSRAVRSEAFSRLSRSLGQMRIDCLIVEKAKTGPALQPGMFFYPRMLGYLLKYVMDREQRTATGELIVVTDTLPIQKQRKAITKAIRIALSSSLPKGLPYRILHHASRAHYGLQIADYCCWAVYRKWEQGDTNHYATVQPAIRSEFDIFQTGSRYYY